MGAEAGRTLRRGGDRADLEAFSYEGERIKLIDHSPGIRNPRQLAAAISILSTPQDPYDDIDRPMLRHGLQEVAGVAAARPPTTEARPDREAPEERYETFRRTA